MFANWTGDQVCRPAAHVSPRTREELEEAVRQAASTGRKVKVAGSGHSFSAAAMTDGVLVHLEQLNEVAFDGETVSVGAGIVLRDLSHALAREGRALENLGDIDKQTLAGAISTATHGTGVTLPNISAQVAAIELVGGSGELVRLSEETDAAGLRAARVSIGALGAISQVTLRTVAAFNLHREDRVRRLDDVLRDFDREARENDHFEFFAFPYASNACTVSRNRTTAAPKPRRAGTRFITERVIDAHLADGLFTLTGRFNALIPYFNRLGAWLVSEGEYIEPSYEVFSSERPFRFTEMEYALPYERGPEAAARVLEWVQRNRFPVAFPIECRAVAGDDAPLSPCFERDSFCLSVHQYRGMEWRPYFEAVEQIAADYGGRPHWGKRHHLGPAELAARYPSFEEFLAVRERLDPARVFANDYTRQCLGD
jgi:L-gulono-1,4-lactone dehydrogenase